MSINGRNKTDRFEDIIINGSDIAKPKPPSIKYPTPTPTPTPPQNNYNDLVMQAYAEREKRLKDNLNNTMSQLERSLNYGIDSVNKNANKAQQQAYISYMMGKKDMPQTLSALGITGGMSESTAASLQNSYGNSRNVIDYGRNEDIASVRATYDANKTEALNAYNGQLDSFDMNKLAHEIDYSKQLASQQQAAAQAATKKYHAPINPLLGVNLKQDAEEALISQSYKRAANGMKNGKPINEIEDELLGEGIKPEFVSQMVNHILDNGG